jgi:hypothetical protein
MLDSRAADVRMIFFTGVKTCIHPYRHKSFPQNRRCQLTSLITRSSTTACNSMCSVSAPYLSQWLLILGLLCPWCLASSGTWRVLSHWHLCSIDVLLVGDAITPYVRWSFHWSFIPTWGFLPSGGVGWQEVVEPECAPRCHYELQREIAVPGGALACAPFHHP